MATQLAELTWQCSVQRLRILEFTIDHEAPYFSKMRRRTSRRDSDLNGVVDVRYTGGARMLLLIEAGQGRWRFKVRPALRPSSGHGPFPAQQMHAIPARVAAAPQHCQNNMCRDQLLLAGQLIL